MSGSMNIIIREWLNGALIPINLCIIFITVYTVWNATHFKRGWARRPGASSACALMWVFIADLMRATAAWIILHYTQVSKVEFTGYMAPSITAVYMISGVIALSATMRLIYVLSPLSWGHRGWIAALLATIIFLAAVSLGMLEWL